MEAPDTSGLEKIEFRLSITHMTRRTNLLIWPDFMHLSRSQPANRKK